MPNQRNMISFIGNYLDFLSKFKKEEHMKTITLESAPMSVSQAIVIVEEMQMWRRGKEPYLDDEGFATEMPHSPKLFGEAIDVLLDTLCGITWKHVDEAVIGNDIVLIECDGGMILKGYRLSEKHWWTFKMGLIRHEYVNGWIAIPKHINYMGA